MIQPGERTEPASVGVHLAALARDRVALLWTEVTLGSPVLSRVALVTMAIGLQTIVLLSPGHFRPASSAFFAILVAACTLASLALAGAASLPLKELLGLRARQTLAASGLLLLALLSVVGTTKTVQGVTAIAQGVPYGNDGAAMDLYAAERLRQGHNPYSKTNIVNALAAINAPSTTVTPLMAGQFRGAVAYPSEGAIQQVFLNVLHYRDRHGVPIPREFESKYNYPAGSFLVILPFVWMDIQDMRFLYALAALGMGVYLWWRMPRSLRLLVPFLVASNVPIIAHLSGGQPDPIYGLLLLLAYAEWPSAWLSPLLLGLSVATKQLSWFFVPFYLILIYRQFGRREVLRRSGIVAALFLVTNGPFIIESPSSYISSISGPMTDPMFPLGVGAIALFVSNVIPMVPKVAFTVAELASWLGGAVAFWRLRAMPAAMGLALGAVPLFFAWRSLITYFYLVPLIALAVVLADSRRTLAPSNT